MLQLTNNNNNEIYVFYNFHLFKRVLSHIWSIFMGEK